MISNRARWVSTLLAALCVAQSAQAIDKANGKHKVLFLTGKPSHGYGAHDHLAGCMLLSKSLNESGLSIESQVYHYDWPTDPKIFDNVDCVVMYGDGGPGHMFNAHLEELDALAKKGVQFDHDVRVFDVCSPKRASQVLERSLLVSAALPCAMR